MNRFSFLADSYNHEHEMMHKPDSLRQQVASACLLELTVIFKRLQGKTNERNDAQDRGGWQNRNKPVGDLSLDDDDDDHDIRAQVDRHRHRAFQLHSVISVVEGN